MVRERSGRQESETKEKIPQTCLHPDALRPIPSALHSVYEGGPFRSCTVCSLSLDSGCLYEIQKVFHGEQTIFEMALCRGCGEEVCQDFSQESMEALKGFLLCKFTPGLRAHHCNFCASPQALFSRFTLVGACRRDSLILPSIVLCDHCGELLQSKISPRTRERQEDFLRTHFPGVPGALDLSPSFGGLLA